MYLTKLVCTDKTVLFVFSKTSSEDLVFSLKREVANRNSRRVSAWLDKYGFHISKVTHINVRLEPKKKTRRHDGFDMLIDFNNIERIKIR